MQCGAAIYFLLKMFGANFCWKVNTKVQRRCQTWLNVCSFGNMGNFCGELCKNAASGGLRENFQRKLPWNSPCFSSRLPIFAQKLGFGKKNVKVGQFFCVNSGEISQKMFFDLLYTFWETLQKVQSVKVTKKNPPQSWGEKPKTTNTFLLIIQKKRNANCDIAMVKHIIYRVKYRLRYMPSFWDTVNTKFANQTFRYSAKIVCLLTHCCQFLRH